MWMFQEMVRMAKTSYELQLLFLTSIIGFALFIERLIFFMRNTVRFESATPNLLYWMQKGDLEAIKNFAYSKNTPFHNILKTFVDNFDLPEDLLMGYVDARILRERERATKYLNGLATVAVVSPLLGLYGTVTGLIEAFHRMAETGAGGPEVVGRGISIALLTTMLGLFIAIPTLIAHNIFARKAGEMAAKSDATIRELLITAIRYNVKK